MRNMVMTRLGDFFNVGAYAWQAVYKVPIQEGSHIISGSNNFSGAYPFQMISHLFPFSNNLTLLSGNTFADNLFRRNTSGICHRYLLSSYYRICFRMYPKIFATWWYFHSITTVIIINIPSWFIMILMCF